MKLTLENRIPTIKASLPITFVLDEYGHDLVKTGKKFSTICMFHNDTNPSLDVFGEHFERWGCFACGIQGDVFDLIGKLEGCGTNEAINKAQALLDSEEFENWDGPSLAEIKPFDRDVALAMVERAAGNEDGVHQFIDRKVDEGAVGLTDVSAQYLVDRWRLGSNGQYVTIPYYNRAGELITYKYRTPDTKAFAAAGSVFTANLYGEWLDDGVKPVLLCEGETDVWAADFVLSDKYSVLGIPTGARSAPKQAVLLAGREVIIAFDGDDAGRAGARAWGVALQKANATVYFVPVGTGQDLASCYDIPGMLNHLITPTKAPEGLEVVGGVYTNGKKELCGWSFVPKMELLGDGGYSFTGNILPEGGETVLSSSDLATSSTLNKWAMANGHTWRGDDREARLLHDLLHSDSIFLPKGKRASKAGIFGSNFVWPGGSIGPEPWIYSPPIADTQLEGLIKIQPGPWSVKLIPAMRELNDRGVMDPILAWLAAAPLRSKFPTFPVLAVTGSSGSGKTTLLSVVLSKMLGCSIAYNLVGTTPYAMTAIISSTNGFPVWFDEYRPQAGKKILDPFNQMLRDAYTRQGSIKGGMRANWSELEVMSPDAPIIVSGEDAFTETSHTERMIQVLVPNKGRSPEALSAVSSTATDGFAHAYLSWLLSKGVPQVIDPAPFTDDPLLPDRCKKNLAILYWGWDRLTEFCRQFGQDLSEPDFSTIRRTSIESSLSSPIHDAIIDCLEDQNQNAVRVDQTKGEIHIAPGEFVSWAGRRNITLPGGRVSLIRYLVDVCEGTQTRSRLFGPTQVRVVVISHRAIEKTQPDTLGRFGF